MRTYTKFMKDILTKKMRCADEETIHLDASYNAIIKRILPQKERDHGRIMLPITIGNVNVGKTLIDLGSSINIMLLLVIKRICGLDMKHTKMTLKLANKSIIHRSRIYEYVLVKVDKLLFPIDFFVANIEEDGDVPLILGKPFMKITGMVIDINDRLMKFRVQDEEVNFKLFAVIKHSKDKGLSHIFVVKLIGSPKKFH